MTLSIGTLASTSARLCSRLFVLSEKLFTWHLKADCAKIILKVLAVGQLRLQLQRKSRTSSNTYAASRLCRLGCCLALVIWSQDQLILLLRLALSTSSSRDHRACRHGARSRLDATQVWPAALPLALTLGSWHNLLRLRHQDESVRGLLRHDILLNIVAIVGRLIDFVYVLDLCYGTAQACGGGCRGSLSMCAALLALLARAAASGTRRDLSERLRTACLTCLHRSLHLSAAHFLVLRGRLAAVVKQPNGVLSGSDLLLLRR